MGLAARLCLSAGVTGLGLCVANQLTAPELSPALERAGVLASFLAVGLMLVSILWTRAVPIAPERVELSGDQGFDLAEDVPEGLRQELAWGSQMLLTATPAATVLLHWQGRTLLQRGVLGPGGFEPGAITQRAWTTGKAIGLVNLKLYPGRDEFAALPEGIPALIVQPIDEEGVLLLAGWSPRCFSRSDEAWVEGWSLKLRTELLAWSGPSASQPSAAEAG
ncbi:MAG: cofactor assembly of complex C subunit B [Vulcanococcus sp.]|jgi:hypothetical protein